MPTSPKLKPKVDLKVQASIELGKILECSNMICKSANAFAAKLTRLIEGTSEVLREKEEKENLKQ